MPVACASSLAEERSAYPNLTLRSSLTLWSDPGERLEPHIGWDLTAAGVRKKAAGKPGDQGGQYCIDLCSGAEDGDANVGSRVRECPPIRAQESVGTDEGFRRWKGLFRDAVTALVNRESWKAAGP